MMTLLRRLGSLVDPRYHKILPKPRFARHAFPIENRPHFSHQTTLTFGELDAYSIPHLQASSKAVATSAPSGHRLRHSRLKAAILDWSGTTADEHVLAPAVVFVEVFKKHGVSISMKEARKPMGLRKDLHIAQILEDNNVRNRWMSIKGRYPTDDDTAALFADFVPMQLDVLPQYCDLIPGTVEAVNALRKDLNLKIGSTTGFTRVMVDVLLKHANEQGFHPDCTVAGDEVDNNMGFRPAPFMVYENMCKLGVWPIESVVKVDDTVSGVGEGLTAGCWTVGLADRSNYTDVDSMEQWQNLSCDEQYSKIEMSRNVLFQSGAHYVADNISSLPDICKHINQRLAAGESPQSRCDRRYQFRISSHSGPISDVG